MVNVRVPATSANVGCGFDSLGIALTLYTTFGFEERFSNEDNLVYQTLLTTLTCSLSKLSNSTLYATAVCVSSR